MPEAIAKTSGSKKPTLLKQANPGATVTKSPGSKKAKQTILPTMEDMQDSEIVRAAEAYTELRDERMALLDEETKAKQVLLDVMLNKNRTTYKLESGEVVEVHEEKKLNVTVRKPKGAKKDDE